MNSFAEVARVRRQQVVNLSITELMILLVFMSITYSFLAREEDRKEVPQSQQEWTRLKADNERLKIEVRKFQQERDLALTRVTELERLLKQLFPDAPVPVPNPPNNSFVAISKSALAELQARAAQADELRARAAKFEEMQTKVTNLEQQVLELNTTILELRKRLDGGKAPGRPRCPLTGTFLLAITANTDGSFTGVSASDKTLNSQAYALPGIEALSSRKQVSESEFKKIGAELIRLLETQDKPCRYSIRIKRTTNSFEQWEKQLSITEKFFYVKRD